VAKQRGYAEILAFVDPNAKGFYEKMAARYLHENHLKRAWKAIPEQFFWT
jgi:hypothetical protein